MLRPLARIAAALLLAFGAYLTGIYVCAAIIEPWGQPDQSYIFWLSPLPMIGLSLAAAGYNIWKWAGRPPE